MSKMAEMAFPLKPPSDWFSLPEADTPTPLTFEKNGKVYGHIALWGSCHIGFINGALKECVEAPQSRTNYKHFHVGVLETQEGEDVQIGKITYDTGHAPISAGLSAASSHYDQTGAVGAFVRARDGNLGIWASGSVKSDLSPEGFRDLRANGPSGDWRGDGRALEMVAALAVPVQGFPVLRPQVALAASANGDTEVVTLILPPWQPEVELALVASAEYQERKRALSLAAGVRENRRSRDYMRRLQKLRASV